MEKEDRQAMAARGRNRHNGNKHHHVTPTPVDEGSLSLAGDSPILSVFLKAARHLTDRQDRHERLIRQSRDVTIESKRIIFLLHSAVTKEKTKEMIIAEAKDRIQKLINDSIKAMAMELNNVSAYLHYRAITAGLQEFVEARTLLSIMEQKHIISLDEVRNELTFTNKCEDGSEQIISTLLVPLDYMLGLADLSGEMMRKAINGISSGDADECIFACEVVRKLYAGFLGVFGGNQVLNNKLKTTRANVYKVEHALFAFKVRGSEAIPKLMLAPPQPHAAWVDHSLEEDQGCF